MSRSIFRAWDRACHWRDRLLGIIGYHQRNIHDAAAVHAKRKEERLRAAGVAPETIASSNGHVAL